MMTQLVKDLQPYKPPVIVQEDASIAEMAELFVNHPSMHYLCLVDKAGVLRGLIARKKIFQAIYAHHLPPDSMVSRLFTLITSETASDLLVEHIITIGEDDTIEDLINKMMAHDLDSLPVLDNVGKPLGFVNIEMILKLWLDAQRREEGV